MDWTKLPTVKDLNGKKFNQVLTVTDRGSKQVIMIPCWWKDKAPQVAYQFLHEVVRHRGLPSSIVSDRDTKHQRLLEIPLSPHGDQDPHDLTISPPSERGS